MKACRDRLCQLVQQCPVDLIEYVRIKADKAAEPQQLAASVLSTNTLLEEQIAP